MLLDSLRHLTVDVREILVVDDGSRDATASVARTAGARVLPADGSAARVDGEGVGL